MWIWNITKLWGNPILRNFPLFWIIKLSECVQIIKIRDENGGSLAANIFFWKSHLTSWKIGIIIHKNSFNNLAIIHEYRIKTKQSININKNPNLICIYVTNLIIEEFSPTFHYIFYFVFHYFKKTLHNFTSCNLCLLFNLNSKNKINLGKLWVKLCSFLCKFELEVWWNSFERPKKIGSSGKPKVELSRC